MMEATNLVAIFKNSDYRLPILRRGEDKKYYLEVTNKLMSACMKATENYDSFKQILPEGFDESGESNEIKDYIITQENMKNFYPLRDRLKELVEAKNGCWDLKDEIDYEEALYLIDWATLYIDDEKLWKLFNDCYDVKSYLEEKIADRFRIYPVGTTMDFISYLNSKIGLVKTYWAYIQLDSLKKRYDIKME